MVELKRFEKCTRRAVAEFINSWQGEDIIPSSLQKYSDGYRALAEYLHTMETDPPRLLAPSTLWFLTDGEEILGAVEVRHFLNSGLMKYGGHIGYGVSPKHRGNGYAKIMLDLLTPELKKLKLDMVLICCLEENIASKKTIENAGAEFENAVDVIRGGQHKTGLRYWLEIK